MAREKRTSYGINYGPLTNLNPVTGIRFGVISVHELPFFYDEAEAVYANFDPCDCDELGENYTDEEEEEARERFYEYAEPLCWQIDSKECEMAHSFDDGDIFVTNSKYFTYAGFCSPCAPGACYLLDQCDENGPKAYCPEPDMFEEDHCPIDIYSVETGMIVRSRSMREEENQGNWKDEICYAISEIMRTDEEEEEARERFYEFAEEENQDNV